MRKEEIYYFEMLHLKSKGKKCCFAMAASLQKKKSEHKYLFSKTKPFEGIIALNLCAATTTMSASKLTSMQSVLFAVCYCLKLVSVRRSIDWRFRLCTQLRLFSVYTIVGERVGRGVRQRSLRKR